MQYDSTKLHVLKETDTIRIDESSQMSDELLILIDEILNRIYYDFNKSVQVVTNEGILAYMKKIKAVFEIPQPRNVIQLSLCESYRKFIENYNLHCEPLYLLTKEFAWTEETNQVFEKLKHCSHRNQCYAILISQKPLKYAQMLVKKESELY